MILMALTMTRAEQKREATRLKVNEYAARQLAKAHTYETRILSGEIVSCEWIKKGVTREQKLREKYHYDEAEILLVFKFFYHIQLTMKGKLSRFEPSLYQCWMVMCIYGLKRNTNHTKRVRRFFLVWIARKSGKTTFFAILSLYAMMKGERAAEVYFLATSQDQASQALVYLKQIVEDSPALRKRVDSLQYKLRYRSRVQGICVARPLPAEAKRLDGKKPAFGLVDESHELPDKSLFNIMTTGSKGCWNPLIGQVSTAGFNVTYPFYGDVENGKKVLNGTLEDDSTFYALFTLDSVEEVDNPEMWVKANPALHEIIDLEDLVNDYNKAKLTKTDLVNFKVKNLNLFTTASDFGFVPIETVKKVMIDRDTIQESQDHLEETEEKLPCYLGLDLSKNRDLASLCATIGEDKPHQIAESYFPTEQNAERKMRPGGIDLQEWIDDRFITPHLQSVIDLDLIFERVEYYVLNYDVRTLTYDPALSHQLINMLKANFEEIDFIPFKQSAFIFSPVIKQWERMIYMEEISIHKNPVILWQFENIVCYYDTNDNVKFMKNRSLDSIDVPVAMAMSLAGWMDWNVSEYDLIKPGDSEPEITN